MTRRIFGIFIACDDLPASRSWQAGLIEFLTRES